MGLPTSRSVRWAVWFYQVLLAMLPRSFRTAYGDEMIQVFRDVCGAASRRGGRWALTVVWLDAIADLLVGAVGEWILVVRSGGKMLQWVALALGVVAVVGVFLGVGSLGIFSPALGLLVVLAALVGRAMRQRQLVSAYAHRQALVGGLGDPSGLVVGQPKPRAPRLRVLLVGAVAALGAAFVAVLAIILLVAYPPAPALADGAHLLPLLEVWFGASGAHLGEVAIGALLMAGFVAVTVVGTRRRARGSELAWLVGSTVGGIGGVVLVLTGVLTDLSFASFGQSAATYPLVPLFMFGAPLLAGGLVSKQVGNVGNGMLAGFWCGQIVVLLNAVGVLGSDLLFANRLVQSLRLGNPACSGLGGSALAACSISDDLDGVAVTLLVLPLFSAALGGLGGLLGSMLAAKQTPDDAGTERAMVAPAVFAGSMFALLIAEIAIRIW